AGLHPARRYPALLDPRSPAGTMSEPSQTGVGTRPVRAAAEPGVPRTRRSGPVLTSGMPTFDEGVLRRQRDMYADAVPEVRRVVARLLSSAGDSLRTPAYHCAPKNGRAAS